jgi:uncharacterized membrane protein
MSVRTMKRPLSQYAKGAALTAQFTLMFWLAVQQGSLAWLGALLLALPVPGLLRERIYTYQWASMLVAFYSALWLAEGYAQPDRRLEAFGIAAVAAIDFVSLVMFVRWRQRERLAQAPGSDAVSG